MRVRLPSPNPVRVVNYPRLDGGLDLSRLSYRLRPDQSPCMKNLWWQDGVLQSRDGQIFLDADTGRGEGFACYGELFHGKAFFHMGDALWQGLPGEKPEKLLGGVPENRGTFFRYFDWLFYKNRGGYFRIAFDPEKQTFAAEDMKTLAYVPVLTINTDPVSGAGDLYQPENRLSPDKTLWYHAKAEVRAYRLPAEKVEAVVKVTVDGAEKKEGADFTLDKEKGVVTFTSAPPVTDPPAPNTVRITFRKSEPDALKSVMDCSRVFVSGSDRNVCILLAGSEKQPNAVFWNANDDLSMDPGYFPMPAYNLAGTTNDPVTGFGSQYKDLILFKAHSIGRLDFRVDQVEGRNIPMFTYTPINRRVGCDLPDTIQLVENNLVFCNRDQGVHILRSSSAAYENNVSCISMRINGSGTPNREGEIGGLLADLARSGEAVSFDDDRNYWLCVNGHGYLWNYSVSTADDPSWFYQTELYPRAFLRTPDRRLLHLDREGRISAFARVFSDYGRAIEKVYRFPATDFGTLERLKDVTDAVFSIRSDTESQVEIRYDTDHESRTDRTKIPSWDWTFGRLDLRGRLLGCYNLVTPRYARAARRRPGCRHIRHFSMTLSNCSADEDLAIISAQIFYRYSGKER